MRMAATTLLAISFAAVHGAAVAGANQTRFDDQLTLDVTPVPEGMGALFVPALTQPRLESALVVFSGSRRITATPTGRRVVVPPGAYRVRLDPDSDSLTASGEARVTAGQTVVVRPFYAALQLSASDRRGRLIKRGYVIVDESGTAAVRGATSGRPAAEENAWLLPPGRYRVVLGDDPEGAASVPISVHEADVLRYRLVADGRELVRTELADHAPVVQRSPWQTRWRIGSDLAFNASTDQISAFSGEALQVGAFTEAIVTYDQRYHHARLDLRVNEAWLGVHRDVGRGFPLQKLTDIAEASFTYSYRLGRIVGPYLRAQARASLFETRLIADGRQTVVDRAGGQEQVVDDGEPITLVSGLRPIALQQSAGVTLTLVDTELFTLITRGGAALRQSYYDGGRYVAENSGDRVVVDELRDYNGWGAEVSALATLRVDDDVWVDSALEAYADRDQIFDRFEIDPVFRWRSTVTVSFNETLSLVYDAVVHRDEFGIDGIQTTQMLSLRAHASLL